MAPPTLPRAISRAPWSPKSVASASQREPRPTVLSLRAPAASPLGCQPARGGARSPRARAHVERAGSRPQSPPRSARATEHGLGQRRRCPFQDPASPRLLTQLVGRKQADAHGVECGLGAAPHVQLREDAVHVGLDCTLPDEELARDLLVGFAPSQEPQDLRLASGKSLWAVGGAHLAYQAYRGLRSELNLAGRRCPERPAQLVGLGVLEEVADGPGPYGPRYRSVLQHTRERHNLGVGQFAPDLSCGLYAAHHRHK